MSAAAHQDEYPTHMTYDQLEQLPGDLAKDAELWQGRVVWSKRPPMEHQEHMVAMRSALKQSIDRAEAAADPESGDCWQVAVETNVFHADDKSSFLTPDFMVRRCLPRGSDTFSQDVVLVGEVLSDSDTPRRRLWKMARYAEMGIPWYWEVEVDRGDWQVAAVRVFELITTPVDVKVKLLHPQAYLEAGVWERDRDAVIDFPEPFAISIDWGQLTL